MTDSHLDRCKRICGGMKDRCFVENKEQLVCISDMVINKVSGIKVFLETALKEKNTGISSEYLSRLLQNIDDLVNWVKFLQIIRDVKDLSALIYPSADIEERRNEQRFPFPDIYWKFIEMKIRTSGGVSQAFIVNFSPHGIKFICPFALEVDSVVDCAFSTTRLVVGEVNFRASIKHCSKRGNDYMVGARLEEVDDQASFDFFNKVYDIILEIIRQEMGGI